MSTQPLKLKVLKPGAPPPDAIASGTQPAFLKLVLPKQQVYLGEPMRAEIQLYVRDGVGISGLDRTSFPAEGFNVSQQMLAGAQRSVRIGAAGYQVLPILFTVKPVKTGVLNLGPVTFSAVMELPSRDSRRDPFFEQFGMRSPFYRGEQKRVVLATETTNLQCLAWPSQNVPPGFNGAVGNYTMTVTAGPTNLMAGDPITLRVRIAGRGALDGLVLPEQPEWRNFKVFPPTAKPLESTDPFGLQGARTFEQIVVPQSAEIKELPQFSFSFFDPEAGTYRTLTQPATPLIVRPGGSVAAPTFVAAGRPAQDAPPPAQDIVHIKPRLGAVAQAGPPLVGQRWFILLQTVPVLAWVWALAWRRQADRLANNPRLRRRRQLGQIIRDGLAEMRRLAAENQSDKFFADALSVAPGATGRAARLARLGHNRGGYRRASAAARGAGDRSGARPGAVPDLQPGPLRPRQEQPGIGGPHSQIRGDPARTAGPGHMKPALHPTQHLLARIFHSLRAPLGCRSYVAQVSNLLYRRLPVRRLYLLGSICGLEIRDTAGWKPALRLPVGETREISGPGRLCRLFVLAFLLWPPAARPEASSQSNHFAQVLRLPLAGSPEVLAAGFEAANKLYEEGKYADAAASYERLLKGGQVSAALYFNLGNAAFKSSQIGRAIAAYRQAQRLAPRDPDVRANLQFARNQVQGPTLPVGRWQRWLNRFTLNEWTVMAAAAAWLLFLLLALLQWRPALKATLRQGRAGGGGRSGIAGRLPGWGPLPGPLGSHRHCRQARGCRPRRLVR